MIQLMRRSLRNSPLDSSETELQIEWVGVQYSEELDGTPAFYVQTAEDLVLSKLQWFMVENQVLDRQWNDIQASVAVNQFALDFDYLELGRGVGKQRIIKARIR